MSLTSPIRPLYQAQTYRNLLFLAAGIPIAAVVLGLVIAGWTSIAVLAITPLVVPLLLGYRALVGLLARGDAKLARSLLGVRPDPPAWSEGRGFWGRAKAVVLDPTFWRQQGYLLLRMTLGFAFAVGELALIAAAVSAVTLPIWYRWSAPEYGSWHADTLGRALMHVPVGAAGLIVAAWLARILGSFSAWQVRSLLGPLDEFFPVRGQGGDHLRVETRFQMHRIRCRRQPRSGHRLRRAVTVDQHPGQYLQQRRADPAAAGGATGEQQGTGLVGDDQWHHHRRHSLAG